MASILSLLDYLYDLRYFLLAFAVAFVLRQQWDSYHRLSGFNGPFLARFTNLWLARSVGSRKLHLELYETSLKYGIIYTYPPNMSDYLVDWCFGSGELARVGPNVLLTSDPELMQRMSSTKSGYTRSEWYSSHKLDVDRDNLFSTLDGKLHSGKRAKIAKGVSIFTASISHVISSTDHKQFTGKDVEGLEATAEKHLLKLLDLIKRKYTSTPSEYRPMDFARKDSFFTMDFTTDISLGDVWRKTKM
jgi:hypothetical protein